MTGSETRTNDEWLAALCGDAAESVAAVRDLEVYLGRVLRRTVPRLADEDRRDLIQESLARIVASLASFRGDSAFPTWAGGVAVRTALSELRRRRARAEGPARFDRVVVDVDALASTEAALPEAALGRRDLLGALGRAIVTSLTVLQRRAIVAELRGIPTLEIARRLGTNPNALYKLTHDARRRLKIALLDAGYDATSLHEALTAGAATGNDEVRR